MEAWKEELYHYGVKGMKWGVRRYQNADGSYTAAGRQHYGIGDATSKLGGGVVSQHKAVTRGLTEKTSRPKGQVANAMLNRDIKRGKDKAPISSAEAVSSEAGRGLSSASSAMKSIQDIRYKKQMGNQFTNYDTNISQKSDAQLKKEINRMRSEIDWDNLNQQVVERGHVYATDYLEIVKDVTMTAASVASIAAVIYMAKNK